MIERTFFVSGGVLVTNVSFKIPARSYPMSGITSVKGARKDPSPAGPILLAKWYQGNAHARSLLSSL